MIRYYRYGNKNLHYYIRRCSISIFRFFQFPYSSENIFLNVYVCCYATTSIVITLSQKLNIIYAHIRKANLVKRCFKKNQKLKKFTYGHYKLRFQKSHQNKGFQVTCNRNLLFNHI